MRIVQQTAISFTMVIGALPCLAQSTLTGPVKIVDEPIAMSYAELETTNVTGSTHITFFKDGQKLRNMDQDVQATVTVHIVGKVLEILATNRAKASVNDRSYTMPDDQTICFMHNTGELVSCEPSATITYPLYDHPNYRSGDAMKIPFGAITGTAWVMNGEVKGRSSVGQRPVLVIDFAESRVDKVSAPDKGIAGEVRLEVTGHAYLDLATGYPVEMEISAEMSGSFSRDYDRMLMSLKEGYVLPGSEH